MIKGAVVKGHLMLESESGPVVKRNCIHQNRFCSEDCVAFGKVLVTSYMDRQTGKVYTRESAVDPNQTPPSHLRPLYAQISLCFGVIEFEVVE